MFLRAQGVVTGLIGLVVIAGTLGGCSASELGTTTSTVDSHVEKPAAPEKPKMTRGQENALASAKNYLDMSGFSRVGLIQQLSSSAGEGFSKADATFAVNHAGADWNAEAVEAAKSYLESTPMSKQALIEQLSSSAGENFTLAQARYAANKVY
jgi:hypothetical protein